MKPKLIHDIDIEFKNVTISDGAVDPDYEEDVSRKNQYGTVQKIKAQIKNMTFVKIVGSASGFELDGNG
jgi:hypothetical protein